MIAWPDMMMMTHCLVSCNQHHDESDRMTMMMYDDDAGCRALYIIRIGHRVSPFLPFPHRPVRYL